MADIYVILKTSWLKNKDIIDKNTYKIREEIKGNSKAQTEITEMSSKNLNSNEFYELDYARTIDDICKSCSELKYH